ncbi:Pterocarpan synthase 1 [Linum perenne]
MLSPATLGLKKEKLSHLRFFFHDIVSGPNPTAVQIAQAHSTNLSSTLSVLGRNAVMSPVREMPVIGGSGVFRFARGYAQAKTLVYDLKSGNAVVEYNVFVFHY